MGKPEAVWRAAHATVSNTGLRIPDAFSFSSSPRPFPPLSDLQDGTQRDVPTPPNSPPSTPTGPPCPPGPASLHPDFSISRFMCSGDLLLKEANLGMGREGPMRCPQRVIWEEKARRQIPRGILPRQPWGRVLCTIQTNSSDPGCP